MLLLLLLQAPQQPQCSSSSRSRGSTLEKDQEMLHLSHHSFGKFDVNLRIVVGYSNPAERRQKSYQNLNVDVDLVGKDKRDCCINP